MPNQRESLQNKLIESFTAYYNINYLQDVPNLVARCDYFEHSESFAISQKANLWSADCEEFLYLFSLDHLSIEAFNNAMVYVAQDWKNRAHIGPGHMYTYVTPLFICDSFDDDAIKALKKCRIYKSFKFSVHGWMEYHTALVNSNNLEIFCNSRGKCVKQMLIQVFFPEKRKKPKRNWLKELF